MRIKKYEEKYEEKNGPWNDNYKLLFKKILLTKNQLFNNKCYQLHFINN